MLPTIHSTNGGNSGIELPFRRPHLDDGLDDSAAPDGSVSSTSIGIHSSYTSTSDLSLLGRAAFRKMNELGNQIARKYHEEDLEDHDEPVYHTMEKSNEPLLGSAHAAATGPTPAGDRSAWRKRRRAEVAENVNNAGDVSGIWASLSGLITTVLLGGTNSIPASRGPPRWESYNYEPCDSAVYEAKRATVTPARAKRTSTLRWLYIFLIGAATALVAVGITFTTGRLTKMKFDWMNSLIEQERRGTVPSGVALAAFVAVSIAFAATASALVVLGEPAAAGSGISEIKTTLNGVILPGVLRFRTLVCKAIGNTFAVASGLPVGKEGPMIHSGSIIASMITQGSSTLFGFDSRFTIIEEFRNDREKRDFISCGAAAGVASAFGAPIGGLLFAIEEGTSHWFRSLVWRIFFCSIIAAFILDFFLSGINADGTGGWGVLEGNGMLSFGSFAASGQTKSWSVYELPLFLLLGAMGGAVGALFNGFNRRLTLWRRGAVPPSAPLRRWAEVVAITTVHSVLKFTLSYALGSCQPRPDPDPLQPYTADLQSFYCPDAQYNDVASMFMVPAEDAIKQLFHFTDTSAFSLVHLLIFFVTYLPMAAVTYGIAVPSGLFIPALLSGSAMGRFVGMLAGMATPDGALVDPGVYALIGAAAILGGTTRMTVSLAVILLECTGNWSFGLPLMTSLVAARWIGNLWNEGIYDLHITLKGWPLLRDHIPSASPAHALRVCDVMATPLLSLAEVEKAGTALAALMATHHHAFPVQFTASTMDAHPRLGTLAGIITRSHLAVILWRKAFHTAPPTQPFALLDKPTASLAAAYAISLAADETAADTTGGNTQRRPKSQGRGPAPAPTSSTELSSRFSDGAAPSHLPRWTQPSAAHPLSHDATAGGGNNGRVVETSAESSTDSRNALIIAPVVAVQLEENTGTSNTGSDGTRPFQPLKPVSAPSSRQLLRISSAPLNSPDSIGTNLNGSSRMSNANGPLPSPVPAAFAPPYASTPIEGVGTPQFQFSAGGSATYTHSNPTSAAVRLRMPSVPSLHTLHLGESTRNALPIRLPSPPVSSNPNALTVSVAAAPAGVSVATYAPSLASPVAPSPTSAAMLASTTHAALNGKGVNGSERGALSPAQYHLGMGRQFRGSTEDSNATDTRSAVTNGTASASGVDNTNVTNGGPQFFADGDVLELLYTDEPLLRYDDLEGNYPHYPDAADISLTPEEANYYIDLRPYLNPCPHTIHVHAPIERAFDLFRALGLRWLLVVNDCHDVVGILTRSDLSMAHLETCAIERNTRRGGVT